MDEQKKEIALKIACNLKIAITRKNFDKKKEERISQIKLAELSGISRSTISRIENAQFVPDILTLVSIARALDIEITELLKGIK